MIVPAILLVLVLAALAWFTRDDVAEYQRFKALVTSRERRRRYLVWIAKQLGYFALPVLIGLALIGRLGALATMPPEFAPLAAYLPSQARIDAMFNGDMALGLLIGVGFVGAGLGLRFAVRGKSKRPVGTVGDIQALLPRNRAEIVCGALLSVSAGVTEELMFRLFLPLLIVLVTGNAVAAFAAPVIIFGLMHRYQGPVGVIATTIVGALFAALYLATRSLAIAMAVHALLDLNGMVLRPALTGALRPATD